MGKEITRTETGVHYLLLAPWMGGGGLGSSVPSGGQYSPETRDKQVEGMLKIGANASRPISRVQFRCKTPRRLSKKNPCFWGHYFSRRIISGPAAPSCTPTSSNQVTWKTGEEGGWLLPPHMSRSSRRGSSTTSLMRRRKNTASLPSISRWSYVSAMYIMGLGTTLPSTTIGRDTMECIPRMADCNLKKRSCFDQWLWVQESFRSPITDGSALGSEFWSPPARINHVGGQQLGF